MEINRSNSSNVHGFLIYCSLYSIILVVPVKISIIEAPIYTNILSLFLKVPFLFSIHIQQVLLVIFSVSVEKYVPGE